MHDAIDRMLKDFLHSKVEFEALLEPEVDVVLKLELISIEDSLVLCTLASFFCCSCFGSALDLAAPSEESLATSLGGVAAENSNFLL